MSAEHWLELLRGVYGERRWIVALDVMAGATRLVADLAALGAHDVFVVAATEGAGQLPECPRYCVDIPQAKTMMEGVRQGLEALANLPEDGCAQIDAFDPGGDAQVIGALFDDGSPVAGRPKFGARTETWRELEDKTRIDALWDATGVARAASAVVPATLEALTEASDALDRGLGCVWVGDNREGFHGGGEYLRWVRTPEQGRAAARFLSAHCDTARVMPFLEGIPCSIHGVVFPDDVVALRPCEMIVLRIPGSNRLHYARAATFWDPKPADREAMRAAAATVGAHLRDVYGYRGAFTIDGVMTAEGFLPTELNPRFGAALGQIAVGAGLPLYLLDVAVRAEPDLDWRPRELEAMLLDVADRQRAGGGMAATRVTPESTRIRYLHETDSGWEISKEEAGAYAKVMWGPSSFGGILMVSLVAERVPNGPSTAPRIAEILGFLDGRWKLGLEKLEPAKDVRGHA